MCISTYICMLFNVLQKYYMIRDLLKLDIFSYSENIISLLYYLFRLSEGFFLCASNANQMQIVSTTCQD